ncbi:MAG: DUF5615 family PIN-like protein [Oligoflexia bacterium]|nr:DUF5615 family PIN-like protein [Oligoflexia bacterium]
MEELGYSVISIAKQRPGISDIEVLELSIKNKAILITEDSDFGELIFSYKKENSGIIYLRYKSPEISGILKALNTVITKYGKDLYNKFVVIKKDRVRLRKL